mgnify:FL=1
MAEILDVLLDTNLFKTKLNLVETSSRLSNARLIPRYNDAEKMTPEKELFLAARKLARTIDDMKKSLTPLQNKMLHAHDLIRKIMGKSLVFGMLNVDNADHMDIVMKRVDIPATEINVIVKSYDSYANLASTFGIKEDDIYTIKGMFR